jgi:hypothetical protein
VDGRDKPGHDDAGSTSSPTAARPEHRHGVIKDSAGPSMTYVKRRNSREFRHPLADAKNGHPLRVIWGGWSGAKRGYDPVSR